MHSSIKGIHLQATLIPQRYQHPRRPKLSPSISRSRVRFSSNNKSSNPVVIRPSLSRPTSVCSHATRNQWRGRESGRSYPSTPPLVRHWSSCARRASLKKGGVPPLCFMITTSRPRRRCPVSRWINSRRSLLTTGLPILERRRITFIMTLPSTTKRVKGSRRSLRDRRGRAGMDCLSGLGMGSVKGLRGVRAGKRKGKTTRTRRGQTS